MPVFAIAYELSPTSVTTQGIPHAIASPTALENPSPQAEAEQAISSAAVIRGMYPRNDVSCLQKASVVFHRMVAGDQTDQYSVLMNSKLRPKLSAGIIVWMESLAIKPRRNDDSFPGIVAEGFVLFRADLGVVNNGCRIPRKVGTCPDNGGSELTPPRNIIKGLLNVPENRYTRW
jgi:hypothetical protein